MIYLVSLHKIKTGNMKNNHMIIADKKVSKEYQKPELVDLNEIEGTQAACTAGSGDYESCTAGNSAMVGACTAGFNPKTACTAGTNPA